MEDGSDKRGRMDEEEEEDSGHDGERRKRKKGLTLDWTAVEEAQLKKAMIVLGNKVWKEMAKYMPHKSATQLREKYRELGGAWRQLKPLMHEHRFLAKQGRLHEREVLLTEEERLSVELGGEMTFQLEKPHHAPSMKRAKGDEEEEEEEEDDEDDDEDDDELDSAARLLLAGPVGTAAPKKRPINKPVSAVLCKLTPEDQDRFKRKRVDEIFENNHKHLFEHVSMKHLARLRQQVPAPPPPPEPSFGQLEPAQDVTARVTGTVSAKLLGAQAAAAAAAGGRSCAVMSVDAAAQATLESSRDFLRAPVFVKSSPEDPLLRGKTPEEWAGEAKTAATEAEGKKSGKRLMLSVKVPPKGEPVPAAPAPAPAAPAPAPSAPRGVMKAGLARPKNATAAAAAAALHAASTRAPPPPKASSSGAGGAAASKKASEAATRAARHRVETVPVPPMDQYVRRHLDAEPRSWTEFRRTVALEQHVAAIVRRSGGDAASEVARLSVAIACEEAGLVLDAAVLGGGAVRSLHIGEPEKTAATAVALSADGIPMASASSLTSVFILTHWLPEQMEQRFVEAIVRTNLTRTSKGDACVGALHSSGLMAAVATGGTITVFDLSQAGPQPGIGGTARPVSIHSESNAPITHLSFSHHAPKSAFLCSYDGQVLRVWRAWTTESSKKFITPLTHGDSSAPYVVSTTLLHSFRDPLGDAGAPYTIAWHPRGDSFVTYSSNVARVWRFRTDSSAGDPIRNPVFEHRAMEGIVAASFLPDVASDVVVVLSAQQKLRFIDVSRPNDFAKVCSTVQGLPWSGFAFHPHMPRLVYGVTPSDNASTASAVTALCVESLAAEDDDSQLVVSRAYFGVPEERRNPLPNLRPEAFPARSRSMLCVDPNASLLCWFDAAKSSFVCVKFLPSL
jgi:hypothetical protein